MVSRAKFDTMRTILFSGISASYAAVGAAMTKNVRAFCITNNTVGDLIFSLDNTDTVGQMFVAAGSYKLYDVQSNINPQFDDRFVLAIGDQFYVKQSTAPASGGVWIELLY